MKTKYFLIILVLGFPSCKKEASNKDTGPQVDVYVSGFVSDYRDDYVYPRDPDPYYRTDPEGAEYPSYWKNGNLVKLDTDLLPNVDYGLIGGRALSIAVSGNDVYVLGSGSFVSPRTVFIAGISWKNDIRDDNPSGSTLAVLNNDVYKVKFDTYYKNEIPVGILDGFTSSDLTTSITVSGNDVYVAGIESPPIYSGSQNHIATYWKNGNPIKLTDGTNSANTWSIAVSGTDVYVAGCEENSAVWVAQYWKNGNLVKLTDGITNADATAVAVSGTDVYIAGSQWNGNVVHDSNGNEYRNSVAKYWKNGNPVNLTDGSKWAEAKSIAVSGNDVYVAGFEDGVAKYWKNGSPVNLGDVSKYSEAYSIFLLKR